MEDDVVLEFMDGRREEAQLMRPFQPTDKWIRVRFAASGQTQLLSLSKICCVLMSPQVHPKDFPVNEQSREEVVTVTGKRFHVATLNNEKLEGGFYALLRDTQDFRDVIFFTIHGVKSREKENPIGEILEEEGHVTKESIDKALERQQMLRDRRIGEILAEQQNLPHRTIESAIDDVDRSRQAPLRMKVGDILIEAGLVTKEQVDKALAKQGHDKKKKIGRLLIDDGAITEDQLLMALAAKFRLPFVDLDTRLPTHEALACLPIDVVYALQVLPLDDNGKRIVVATSEPTDYNIPDSLRFCSKRRIELVIAKADQIASALLKYYPKETPKKEYGLEELINDISEEQLIIEEEQEIEDVSESDSQIVTLVHKILMDGYMKKASDIHFEPGERDRPLQIRYRIDGVCKVVQKIPAVFKRAIISRIKIMSNLDIAERRKPQSGKIMMWHHRRPIEFRVEVTPTIGGKEDAVLRILTSSKPPMPLEDMLFSQSNLEGLKSILKQPYGLILCVGPTGSGKTTTLHSALKHLNTPEVKIWTIEDPVEITQEGLRQVQVNAKIGLTFAEALRSFLRSDPDVIMIGEMRDSETAKTAIEASLTGHLVLSTLHTNTAPETAVRLIDMGMDPFNFADALLGIISQRLVRRLCEKCRQSYHPDEKEYDDLVRIYDAPWFDQHGGISYSPDLRLMKRVGCESCNGSGFSGRVAIHEFLQSNDEIKRAIQHKVSAEELKMMAMSNGMRTLIMDGIHKVFQGITDIEEVLQVCRYQRK